VTDFRHSYKLRTSQQRQPSTRTHRRVYYCRSRPGLRPSRAAPGIKWTQCTLCCLELTLWTVDLPWLMLPLLLHGSLILLPARMLQAGIVFGGVCVCVRVCVCVSVRTKFQKLLYGNRCNLVGICPVVNAWSGWKLVTFDLDFDLESYFRIFWIQAIHFEWIDLETSCYVQSCFFRISRSLFSFQIISLRSRSLQRRSGSVQVKNYWLEIAGAWSEYLLR